MRSRALRGACFLSAQVIALFEHLLELTITDFDLAHTAYSSTMSGTQTTSSLLKPFLSRMPSKLTFHHKEPLSLLGLGPSSLKMALSIKTCKSGLRQPLRAKARKCKKLLLSLKSFKKGGSSNLPKTRHVLCVASRTNCTFWTPPKTSPSPTS